MPTRTTTSLLFLALTALLGGCMAETDVGVSQETLMTCEDPTLAQEQILVAIDTHWFELEGEERPDDTDELTEGYASGSVSGYCQVASQGGEHPDPQDCIREAVEYFRWLGRVSSVSSPEDLYFVCQKLRRAHGQYFLLGCAEMQPLPGLPEACAATLDYPLFDGEDGPGGPL